MRVDEEPEGVCAPQLCRLRIAGDSACAVLEVDDLHRMACIAGWGLQDKQGGRAGSQPCTAPVSCARCVVGRDCAGSLLFPTEVRSVREGVRREA